MVLDSSFLVSFFLQQDENHRKAVEIADKNEEEDKLLPELVLFETLTVINYKKGIAAAKEAYEKMITNQQILLYWLPEAEMLEMLKEFFSHDKKLSIEDATVIYLARKTHSPVLSFDRDLIKEI